MNLGGTAEESVLVHEFRPARDGWYYARITVSPSDLPHYSLEIQVHPSRLLAARATTHLAGRQRGHFRSRGATIAGLLFQTFGIAYDETEDQIPELQEPPEWPNA